MGLEGKYQISYGIEESFEEKIARLENLPTTTFSYDFGVNDRNIRFYHLYHGLRFNGIDKLESIIKSGYILCGEDINSEFTSYDGSNKRVICNKDLDNCNEGRYISVIPYIPESIEFQTFVRENIFLELSSDIETLSTFYLTYDDYIRLRKSSIPTKNLYSYALYEYMVRNKIPLDKIISIGIDSSCYVGNLEDTIKRIDAIKEYYGIEIPLKDININK